MNLLNQGCFDRSPHTIRQHKTRANSCTDRFRFAGLGFAGRFAGCSIGGTKPCSRPNEPVLREDCDHRPSANRRPPVLFNRDPTTGPGKDSVVVYRRPRLPPPKRLFPDRDRPLSPPRLPELPPPKRPLPNRDRPLSLPPPRPPPPPPNRCCIIWRKASRLASLLPPLDRDEPR